MRNNTVKVLTIQALIAAIYVVLTVAIAPFSYGAIQLRISESLSQLVVFSKKYWFPITLGVAIANIFSPLGIVDVFFGTLGTGLALAISIFVFKFVKNRIARHILNIVIYLVHMKLLFLAVKTLQECHLNLKRSQQFMDHFYYHKLL